MAEISIQKYTSFREKTGGLYMIWKNKIATTLRWSSEISNKEQKEVVARKVAERVKDGDVIGIGSGSTSFLALQAICEKVKEQNCQTY